MPAVCARTNDPFRSVLDFASVVRRDPVRQEAVLYAEVDAYKIAEVEGGCCGRCRRCRRGDNDYER